MPVAPHIEMLNQQFLVNTLKSSHPLHSVVTAPYGPRKMKETLHSKYASSVDQHLSNGLTDPAQHSSILKSIHTSAVAASINRLGVNPLLGTRPLPISPSERRLSRPQRTTLSQLRSGHCQLMQDYRVRVGQSTTDVCPVCNSQPHTVSHLFDCAAALTSLTVKDLWLNPVAVCDFLSSLPPFASLQSLVTPPPPSPPPSPPPLPPLSPRPPPEPPP